MGNQNEHSYKTFEQTFSKMNEYYNINNNEESRKKREGYLINHKQFAEFRENLKENKNSKTAPCGSQVRVHKLEPSNPKDLTQQIKDGNKFIIINNELFKLLCKQDDKSLNRIIKYKIVSEEIIIYLENNIQLKFKKIKDNILDKSSFLEEKEINNNDKKIDKIYIDVINYFNNEKYFSEKLKAENSQVETYQGFLVDIDWVDKWKEYSFYKNIKSTYLKVNNIGQNIIKDYIKKELENFNLNYDETNNIENFIIESNKQLELPENLNKTFVILNQKFLNSFPIQKNIEPITFYLSCKKIEIIFDDKSSLSFQRNNNIIQMTYLNKIEHIQVKSKLSNSKNNNNDLFIPDYLKHLIRNIYFKKEFISSQSIFKQELFQAYLIKKEIIDKIKVDLKFNAIILNIEKNPKFNDIKYQNFEQNFNLISKFLNVEQSEYLNLFNNYDITKVINSNEDENVLVPKKLNNNEKLKYIDDFEIIDKEFYLFLEQKLNKKIDMRKIYFAIINNNNR